MKKITITLGGTDWLGNPTEKDCNNAIEALNRAIENKPQCGDFAILQDVQSVMMGIQEELFPPAGTQNPPAILGKNQNYNLALDDATEEVEDIYAGENFWIFPAELKHQIIAAIEGLRRK